MAKKPATVEKQHSAESIIALIKTLSPEERDRVFKFTNGSTQNTAISQVWQELITTLKAFHEIRQTVGGLQRKRGMAQASRETLDTYESLYQECGKQITALLRLVNIPSEQNKPYAKKFRETGDEEALRQTINGLVKTRRKQDKKHPLDDAI